jgi:hypothetical protein
VLLIFFLLSPFSFFFFASYQVSVCSILLWVVEKGGSGCRDFELKVELVVENVVKLFFFKPK